MFFAIFFPFMLSSNPWKYAFSLGKIDIFQVFAKNVLLQFLSIFHSKNLSKILKSIIDCFIDFGVHLYSIFKIKMSLKSRIKKCINYRVAFGTILVPKIMPKWCPKARNFRQGRIQKLLVWSFLARPKLFENKASLLVA